MKDDFASSASLIDGTVSAGNLELRPQTAWVFEAVLERRFGKDSAATLSYRHERIDNVLDRIAIDGLDAPGNIGPGRINAVALQLGLPLGGLGLEGGRIAFSGEWRASRVRGICQPDRRRRAPRRSLDAGPRISGPRHLWAHGSSPLWPTHS